MLPITLAILWRKNISERYYLYAVALPRALLATAKLWNGRQKNLGVAPLCRDARDGKNGSFADTVSCVLYGTFVTFFGGRKVPCLNIPLSVAPSACEKDVVFFQRVPPFVHQLFEGFCWNTFPRKRIEPFGKFGVPAVERLQLLHHFNEQGYFFGYQYCVTAKGMVIYNKVCQEKATVWTTAAWKTFLVD